MPTGPSRPSMEGAENAENGWRRLAEKTDTLGLGAIRPRKTATPLQERTSSEKNRPNGIRVVPYSPPRIHAVHVPVELRKTRTPRPVSPGSAAERRQLNRRRRSKELDGHSPVGNGHHSSWRVYADSGDSGDDRLEVTSAASWSGEDWQDQETHPGASPLAQTPHVSGPRSATTSTTAALYQQQPLTTYRDVSNSPSPPPSAVSAVSATSNASAASSLRPNSRRHNVIAVHADKTFSLVTREDEFSPSSATAAARSLKSPPLSFATGTFRSSTASASASRDRLFSFSDALGSDHRSSSPLTSVASGQPSRYSHEPGFYSVSPGSSTVCLEPALREPAAPTTPKGKGKEPVTTHVDTHPPAKKASFASDHSEGSLVTASSALSFSASAVSVATNYKVYARSSPPPGPDSDARSPSTADASSASDASTISLPSSSSANVVVLGVSSPAAPPLPVLRRSLDPDQTFASLASYPSVGSFASALSSLSDDRGSTPNVVVLGASSPPAPSRYLADDTNSIPSSPPLPPQADTTLGSFATFDSEPNYVLHHAPSAVSAVYSQESLRVAPLQPLRHQWSGEKLRLYPSHSRESLRHAASLQSLRHAASLQSLRHAASIKSLRHAASIKSLASVVIGQEAASTFFAGQAFLSLSIPPVPVVTAKTTNRFRQQRTLQLKRKPLPLPAPAADSQELQELPTKQTLRHLSSWESIPSSFSSPPSSPALPQQPQRALQRMASDEYQHQWSAQLSTVPSESDGGGSRGSRAVSQSLSVMSGALSGALGRRRSSVGSHSYRGSVSSSLALQMDDARARRSRGDSLLLERPQQSYFAAPPVRTVRDHDEHGDGLADLEGGGLAHQPSRSGLSGFFSNNNSSLRNLHSSASSRSLGGAGFPVWARVYYGSGERRALSRSTSVSDMSQGEDVESLVAGDGGHHHGRPEPTMADTEGGGVLGGHLPRPRKMTSSVWSPHLRRDRHAAHVGVWEPPSSVAWTTASGSRSWTDRRNMQVLCFTVGFVCPFVWMIASVLPLPPSPGASEKDVADAEYGAPAVLSQRMAEAAALRFQSARWWRLLNRVMAVFGLLILGAVAALVVVGVRDHWGR